MNVKGRSKETETCAAAAAPTPTATNSDIGAVGFAVAAAAGGPWYLGQVYGMLARGMMARSPPDRQTRVPAGGEVAEA